MKDSYKNENKELLISFLENTFFKNWRMSERPEDDSSEGFVLNNFGSLEMAIGHACNLGCIYCYYHRLGKELYQNEPVKKSDIIDNVDKLMNFISKNNMLCNLEIFSGEVFMVPYIWEVLDIIYEYQSKKPRNKRAPSISIPTNLSFLKKPDLEVIEKIKYETKRFNEICINFSISGSFDGPFMDELNRPHFSKNRHYNEEFYYNFKQYCDELRLGTHPMIYSNNIEHWIDNFLWYLNESPTSLYLLEVRNMEWTPEQCAQIFYLMRFIINLINKRSNDLKTSVSDFLEKTKGFNLLVQPFTTVGRGFGCSLQSTLNISMNTMNLIPCHRTSYRQYTAGKFIFNKDGSYDIDPNNVEMYLAEQASDSTQIAPCTSCPISKLCGGTCLGSNYESTGDFFTVPPSFCRLSHAKIGGIIKGFEDIGYLDYYLINSTKQAKSAVKFIQKLFKDF